MAVRIDNIQAVSRAADRLRALRDGGAKVMQRAASTLARRLPAQAKRDIGQQYNLPAKRIGSALRCRADATSVTLTAVGRPLGLTLFGARQNGPGVKVTVERGRSVTIPHAFIRTPRGAISSSGPQVYVRASGFNSAAGAFPPGVADAGVTERNSHGYPIVRLAHAGVAEMLRDPGREDRLIDYGQKVFADEVDRLLEIAHGK